MLTDLLVPDRQTTLLEEARAAGRGTWALLVGDRKAPQYFDFSQRGLVGSFVAVLIVLMAAIILDTVFSPGPSVLPVWQVVAFELMGTAGQLGFAAIALRQMARLDGFVPFVTGLNWSTAYLQMLALLVSLIFIPGFLVLVALVVIWFVLMINIGRFLVTLSPMQIAIFIVAQLIGMLVALLVALAILPLPAEMLLGGAAAAVG